MPSKKSKKLKKQRGGVAPSCVSSVDTSRYTCHKAANLHNNRQTSRDLDSAFSKASGMKGGARHPSGCGCSSNTTDFKGYLKQVGQQLGQSGGGVSTMVEDMVGGQPVYRAYDDCCPPSLIGGKLNFGQPGRPGCGAGMTGGARKSKKSSKSNYSKKNSKARKTRKYSKSKKTNKTKKTNKNRKQRGGHYNRSKPANYPNAHETNKSHFGEVTEKDFTQRQPFFNEMSI